MGCTHQIRNTQCADQGGGTLWVGFFASLLLLCFSLYVCVCLCECRPHTHRNCKGWKRVSGPLEMELQAAGNHPLWVLRTKLGPSGKAATICSHTAVSPAGFLVEEVNSEVRGKLWFVSPFLCSVVPGSSSRSVSAPRDLGGVGSTQVLEHCNLSKRELCQICKLSPCPASRHMVCLLWCGPRALSGRWGCVCGSLGEL